MSVFSLLFSLLGSALASLTKYFLGRKAASDAVKASNRQAQAEANESTVRDDTARQVAIDRENNDALLDASHHDAGAPGGLRKQSADIDSAISDANSEVR